MNLPSLLEMLQAGVHFGHRTSKWHPNMAPYIFGTKKNVHIINLELSQQKLAEAGQFVQQLAAAGKTILFVGTKQQVAPIVKKYAQQCNMPSMTTRWVGGLFTNYKEVSAVARKLTKLKQQRESGDLAKYTKKEQLEIDREIARLEAMVGGIEQMRELPDAIFIVDLKHEKTALQEAITKNVPVVALCDTNVDAKKAQYPIPGNDDAIKSVEMIMSYIAEAITEGHKHPVEKVEKIATVSTVSGGAGATKTLVDKSDATPAAVVNALNKK